MKKLGAQALEGPFLPFMLPHMLRLPSLGHSNPRQGSTRITDQASCAGGALLALHVTPHTHVGRGPGRRLVRVARRLLEDVQLERDKRKQT
jgi:hypothetical protein